jgi:hypothetical protein
MPSGRSWWNADFGDDPGGESDGLARGGRRQPAGAGCGPVSSPGRGGPAIGRLRQRPKPVFPFASVAALVALAVMAWTLAGWNDARRAGRQEADDRLAERPVAIPTEESVVR